MNNDFWQTHIISAAICLTPFLILSVVGAIRAKSFRAGFWMFLLFALIVSTTFVFVWLYETYLPVSVREVAETVTMFIAVFTAVALGVLYTINAMKAGKVLQRNNNAVNFFVTLVIVIAFTPALIFLFFMNGPSSSGIGFLSLLAIVLLVQYFLSLFEIRQNGFVSRGKVILFSNIESGEWENLMNKEKLRIRLKDSSKTLSIKTPWEMITLIDNYIKSDFLHP
jgi:hypothetical protein